MWIAIANGIGTRQGVGGGVGPTPPPPYTPPLDTYTDAAAAYSVRLLRTAYSGSSMRVRRFVPPYDEQDIGFTAAGDLDEAAIVAFGGSDALTVSAWYDQSGQSNHAEQITPGSQPQIYDGTAVITENGKAAVKGGNMSVSSITFNGTNSGYFIVNNQPPGSFAWVLGNTTSVKHSLVLERFGKLQWRYSGGLVEIASGATMGQQNLLYAGCNSSKSDASINGVDQTNTAAYPGSSDTISSLYNGRFGANVGNTVFQEIIYYDSDQDSNRTSIETNINGYFDIYTEYNPDPATSGFLFDYPDAAAAYSVRQLNNNATYAMRVRRTVAPFDEQDIGFDGNGDLDETAITTFGGSDVLTVSAWYDQSSQQRHAEQITPGAQPQIYDGTAVTDVIGRPGVDFYNVIDRYMRFSQAATSDFTVSYVGALEGNTRNSIVGFRGAGGSNVKFIRTAFQKIGVGTGSLNIQSGYGSIPSGLNAYSIITDNSSSTATVYKNNASIVSGTIPSISFDTIGGTDTGNAGVHSEIVIWESVFTTTDRTGVYNNQDTYYSIP